MAWLLIDTASHEIVSGPHDAEPEAADGQYARLIMVGWPDTVDWVPAMQGFVRKPASAPRRYTFNEWVDRFPFEAQVAIVTATTTDPVAKLIYDRAMSAGASGAIDPADPRTIAGVQYLVSKGVITAEQAAEALA